MTKRLTIALIALAVFVVFAALPVSAASTANTAWKYINASDTVFVGESGLDITTAMAGNGYLAWWAPGEAVTSTPGKSFNVTAAQMQSFTISQDIFESRTGTWYASADGTTATVVAFYVDTPKIELSIWDLTQNKDISGKSVTAGENLTFMLKSNFASIATRQNMSTHVPTWEYDSPGAGNTNSFYGLDGTTKTVYGFVDIKVKTSNGATLTNLYNKSYATDQAAIPLKGMFVNKNEWFWGNATASVSGYAPSTGTNHGAFWATDAKDVSSSRIYPAGTYTVTAEIYLNYIQDFFTNDGAVYTGKTVSASKTVTITTDTVKIEANKDTVVRSNDFSVTVTGKPNTFYYLWVKGVSNLAATGSDDMPPTLIRNQDGVNMDAAAGPYTYGLEYTPENKQTTLYTLVPHGSATGPAEGGTVFYAKVKTNDAGVRTIQWHTYNDTKAQKYTFRVERGAPDDVKSDEVDVTVEKGAVTVTASGSGSYFLGEEIKFSGTNTETNTVYLFIIGPNLPANGGSFVSGGKYVSDVSKTCQQQYGGENPPECKVVDGDASTFKQIDVQDDNTWSWKWGTATVPLDVGTYTVFAVANPKDKDGLDSNTAYGTVSIIIKKPFVSATVSQSTVAKGDKLYIRGTAEGQPTDGVAVWIMGKNYATRETETVNSDSSFEYEITGATTHDMTSGQYFVVVQHPMQNDQFDVLYAINQGTCTDQGVNASTHTIQAGYVYEDISCNSLFKLSGGSRLQGSDAAEALVDAINSPDIDDTYTKLQFLVEEPLIQIDTIGDRHVGDKFTITAQTNLAVDDEVLVEIYSSSFKPTQKSQSGEFSGATGTVLVTKGTTGMNKISFDVDASTFKPDEYIVTETGVLYGTTGTALFNVLEAVPETVAPTTVATPVVTTVPPTTIPPTTATPTKTPTQPGFGALVALIGLGAVAFLVVRRH